MPQRQILNGYGTDMILLMASRQSRGSPMGYGSAPAGGGSPEGQTYRQHCTGNYYAVVRQISLISEERAEWYITRFERKRNGWSFRLSPVRRRV
jgi:hypothetical protein